MKYLVAVSGGVDSVVLLDMLARENAHELTVAHFDHGIREDSAADARFVRGLAETYGLPFVTQREELGAQASEELARTRRYAFLYEEAKKRSAKIVTAHHADDIVETVAINLIRGTGWRGVAVLDNPQVGRPLLPFTKEKLRSYALEKRLEWVEDSTNGGVKYLRNRVRRIVAAGLLEAAKREILALRERQVALKKEIDGELATFVRGDREYGRHLFIQVDPIVAEEILRAVVFAGCKVSLTRPQAGRALLAVKTAKPGTVFEAGSGARLRFFHRTFIVETP